MKEKGQKTRHPGIFRLSDGRFRIVAKSKKDGRQRKRERVVDGTEREAVAVRLALLDEMEIENGDCLEPTSIASYAADWLARLAPRLKTSTADHYRRTLAFRILPELGHVDAAAVTRAHVAEWCAWAESQRRDDGRPYATATLGSWWRVLKQLLQDLAADAGVADPTRRVRPPSTKRRDVRERRTLTAVQVDRLLEAVRARWPAMFAECATLAFTGIRCGELRGLNCGDLRAVDDVRVLAVERSVLHDGSIGETKTGEPRLVPVTPRLAEILDAHVEALRDRGYLAVGDMPLFPGRWPQNAAAPTAARRSFGSHHATLSKASAAIGLGWSAGPQTLRRTLNSRMRETAPGELVRSVLGHATEGMTEHYYGPTLAAARDAVAEAMGTPRGTPSETAGAATPPVSENLK
jgi:integrase